MLRKENLAQTRKKSKTPEDENETPERRSEFRDSAPKLKIRTYAPNIAPATDEEARNEHERRKELLNKFLNKKKKVSEKAEVLKEEIKQEESASETAPGTTLEENEDVKETAIPEVTENQTEESKSAPESEFEFQ